MKLLDGGAARDRDEVAFLKHELLVGKGLNHPQIIKIYDYGADHDCAYLAMELFAAPNMKQWVQQGVEARRRSSARPFKEPARGCRTCTSKAGFIAT